jgi:hypothetical protein
MSWLDNFSGILELLTGFFDYYATLEIRKVIISPRLGRLLPRNITADQLPPELPTFLSSLQLTQPFCLQEPEKFYT